MRKAKYLFGTVVFLLCTLTLTGCGRNPKSVVNKFCEGMQAMDFEKMNECLLNSSDTVENAFSSEDEEMEIFETFIREQSGNMKYKIVDSEVDGDEATVDVKFTYTDASPVITSTMAEYFSQGLALAFAGASEEQMSQLLLTTFQKQIEEATLNTITSTVEIKCKRQGREWKIADVSDDVANVLTCNILKAFESVGESFGGSNTMESSENSGASGTSNDMPVITIGDSSDDNTDDGEQGEEELVFTDIPVGQEVQLSTIKLTVLACKEATEIKGDFSSSTAQEGSKYVIYTVKVENTTKDPSEFSPSDIPLMDDQGRTFTCDTDATFSLDDYILYRETNPNMPETGSFVYNVPMDVTGYGFCVGHADTNENYRFLGQ